VRIEVKDGFHLSPVVASDEAAVVEALQEREIYEKTSRIPWPYTPAEFRRWFEQHLRPEWTFAVRPPDGRLVGVVGFNALVPGHKCVIGYWLARPHWGRGLMTAVVAAFVRHAFEDQGVVRVEAEVFASNPASARLLEKNGFVLEGVLRKHILKDGRLIDARVYALVR
jgi:RimJ/RimL family protein N-acetyltransferase